MLIVNQMSGFGSGDGQLHSAAIRTDSMTGGSGGWNGWNARNVYEAAAFSLPSGRSFITRIRAVLTGPTTSAENTQIANITIGRKAAAGNAWDFAATPVALLFGGSASMTAPNGGSITTDWADFVWDLTGGLVVAMSFNNASHDTLAVNTGLTNVTAYNKNVGDETDQLTPASYSAAGASVDAFTVSSIEVGWYDS